MPVDATLRRLSTLTPAIRASPPASVNGMASCLAQLSPAKSRLQSGSGYVPSSRGPAATLFNGWRQSRASSWQQMQEKLTRAVDAADTETWVPRSPTHLRPDSGQENAQIAVFLDETESAQLGIVRSVWRGAVTSKEGSQTRQMRATRPAAGPVLHTVSKCLAV